MTARPAHRPSVGGTRALGLAVGFAADLVFADPGRGHPVGLFGSGAAQLERLCWRDSRAIGALFALACVVPVAAAATTLQRVAGVRTRPGAVALAVATWTSLGATSLAREGFALRRLLDAGDLDAARRRVTHLCARDPDELDAQAITRAAVESIAENTSDALVAPLLWGLVAGVPGVLTYRAINTLDAMVGYRSPRYRRFGWAAARLDDAANLIPARVTAALAALLAPVVGGSSVAAVRVIRRDGRAHPSPNAGRCEAAFAGALGIRLGGANRYGGEPERRPCLGAGPSPSRADIDRAIRLSRAIGIVTVLLAAGASTAWRRRGRGAQI
ncbi:MAG TPA: cobalamin biosynthesis protein [Pseudonocardiaceae bacterium]|jgi:adenosylcobinamide-phosphate synthase